MCLKPRWCVVNNVDPDLTPLLRRLIRVYTVCSGLSVRILRVYTVHVIRKTRKGSLCHTRKAKPISANASTQSDHDLYILQYVFIPWEDSRAQIRLCYFAGRSVYTFVFGIWHKSRFLVFGAWDSQAFLEFFFFFFSSFFFSNFILVGQSLCSRVTGWTRIRKMSVLLFNPF